MSIEIYYFSGTGNSLHVAKELQQRIPGIKLISILSCNGRTETNSEVVGFIFPIYFTVVPVPVRRFIEKMDLSSAKYIFAITTRFGTECFADVYLKKVLKSKEKQLDSYLIVTMISNSPIGLAPKYLPGIKKQAEKWESDIKKDKIDKLEKEVQNQLDIFKDIIMNKKINQEFQTKSWFKKQIGNFLLSITSNSKAEIPYFADESCNSCGICEKVCLSRKIKMENNKPVWQKNVQCFFCYACFNFCPQQAILVKNKYTRKNGRFFHPQVTIDEIAGQKKML